MSEMYSFGPQVKLQSMGKFTVSPNRNTAWHNQDALKVMHVLFFTSWKPMLCVTYHNLMKCDMPWIRNNLTARTWCHFLPGQCSTALSLWHPKLTVGLLISCVYLMSLPTECRCEEGIADLQTLSTTPSCIIKLSVLVVTAYLTDGRGMMSLVHYNISFYQLLVSMH